mmetsp:Transcript_27509/g.36060  ORF Transcript_27509/g.36060 Transcript_27509/m.36060 type:complete len:297 (+) Transcript_27509:72-962(+)
MYRATTPNEKAHSDGIWTVTWTSKNQILSGSVDEHAKSWDKELQCLHDFGGHRLGVISVKANSTGSGAVTSSIDSVLRFWDLDNGQESGQIDCGPVEAWSIDLSPNDQLVAAGSQRGAVNLWNMESREKAGSLHTRDKFIMSVAFSPDGSMIAAGNLDGIINIFDLETQKLMHKLEGHSLPIRSLCFSPDGLTLMTASDDMRVNVYDVQQTQLVNSFTGHTSWVLCVDCSPDRRHFATSGSDRTVKIWDLRVNQECIHSFDSCHTDQVWSVAYNLDGTQLVSGGDDGVLQMYEKSS